MLELLFKVSEDEVSNQTDAFLVSQCAWPLALFALSLSLLLILVQSPITVLTPLAYSSLLTRERTLSRAAATFRLTTAVAPPRLLAASTFPRCCGRVLPVASLHCWLVPLT